MQTIHDYKTAIKKGVNVIATVEFIALPRQPITRIGEVVKVQTKEYVIKYGQQPNERFWLRFPLAREVELIEGNTIRYATYDKQRGDLISKTTVEIGGQV